MKKLILLFIIPLLFSCNSEPEIVTVDDIYEIEMPGDMTPMYTFLNEDASLQYSSVFSEKYIMIIHENKSEWIDVVGRQNYFMQYVNLLSDGLETNYGKSGYISDIYLNNSKSAKLFEIMPNPLLTSDQLILLKYDNIKSGKYKTNSEIGIPSVRFFDDEVKKYCYMWREGGQFSTDKYNEEKDLDIKTG